MTIGDEAFDIMQTYEGMISAWSTFDRQDTYLSSQTNMPHKAPVQYIQSQSQRHNPRGRCRSRVQLLMDDDNDIDVN